MRRILHYKTKGEEVIYATASSMIDLGTSGDQFQVSV